MPNEKEMLAKLRKYSEIFKDAAERDVNERDTVLYLTRFFEEVLEYGTLAGEICMELPIESGGVERFCDFGLRKSKDGEIVFLVEAKKAGIKKLLERHIEQAANYASRKNIQWVLLTNGLSWQLYHLTFNDGIKDELIFEVNLIEDLEKNASSVWEKISVLSKESVKDGSLNAFYKQQTLLNPKNIVKLLLGDEVLVKLRQELNHKAPERLDLQTVFDAVVRVISPEAMAAAGDISAPRRHIRRRRKTRDANGVEVEVDVPDDESEVVMEKAEPATHIPKATE